MAGLPQDAFMTVSHRMLIAAASAAVFGPMRRTVREVPTANCISDLEAKAREKRIAVQKERYAKRLRSPDLDNTVGF